MQIVFSPVLTINRLEIGSPVPPEGPGRTDWTIENTVDAVAVPMNRTQQSWGEAVAAKLSEAAAASIN